MNLARALCCCLSSGLGILLLTGAPRAQAAVDMRSIEAVDECMVAEICIDRYLLSLYERTPKIDSLKVSETRKAIVKRKGRNRIVTITFSKLVDEDFAWKDPKAAEKAGMSLADYVIGGMNPNFKLTLYHALLALDEAGFAPGITSAFRDDYRQTIATGLKAQTDRSYHGGSFRGGYGYGLAADIVSVKGATRAERLVASQQLWNWIDTHGTELGIARPYLDVDPPHVAPLDGKEYADHRIKPEAQRAAANAKDARKRHGLVLHHDHGSAKHTRTARSSKGRSG
jgi:hypothetical protein